ncbi:MAG: methyltransferase domain-containing protein [Pseudomonadota bacterium]
MDELTLLTELHIDGERQGPGSEAMTRRAIELAGLGGCPDLRILDIGCGTGAATLVLARETGARIVAVDFLRPFLDRLQERARAAGLGGRIQERCIDMNDLDFAEESLDVVWSEGAVYNLGFERGIRAWRPWLKRGGVLAVSELTWLTQSRPRELESYWQETYSEVATAGVKISQLEAAGFRLLGYFPLPESCWLKHYYEPLRERLRLLDSRHPNCAVAQALVQSENREIDLYERFANHVSYGFYIAARV